MKKRGAGGRREEGLKGCVEDGDWSFEIRSLSRIDYISRLYL